MVDEGLERRLDVVAAEASKQPVRPTGASTDCFMWDSRRDGHSLLFTHGGLKMRLSGWKLIDAKAWSETHHRLYPTVHPSGIGLLWYQADVEWSAGKLKGGASNVVLGNVMDRYRALKGLPPNGIEMTAFNDLMFRVERIAGITYGDGLLEPKEV